MFKLQFIAPTDHTNIAGKVFTATTPIETQADGTYSEDLIKSLEKSGKLAKTSFGNAKEWTHFQSAPISNIEAFSAAIEEAQGHNAVLVRGEVAVDQPIILRRHATAPHHIRNVDREWVALDVDNAPPIPDDINIFDPVAVSRFVIESCLPPEFQVADYTVEFTGQHGMKGRNARLRLFFLLDRPVTNNELKAFVGDCKRRVGEAVFDATLFDASHIHYICPPIFKGMADPVPERRALVKGAHRVVAFQAVVGGAHRAYRVMGATDYAVAAAGFKRALGALEEGGVLVEGAHGGVLGACLAYHREATVGLYPRDDEEAVGVVKRAIRKGLATEKAAPREAELSRRMLEGVEANNILRWLGDADLTKPVTELMAQARWIGAGDILLKGEFRDDLRRLRRVGEGALDEETARRYATAMLGRYQTHVPKLKPAEAFLGEVTAAYQGEGRGTEEGVRVLAAHWDYLQGLRKDLIAQTLDVRAVAANACRLVEATGKRKVFDRIEFYRCRRHQRSAAADQGRGHLHCPGRARLRQDPYRHERAGPKRTRAVLPSEGEKRSGPRGARAGSGYCAPAVADLRTRQGARGV